VARTRRRAPYDPSKAHDRRATESNRGVANHLTPKEVDDPFEMGAKIIVMRSTRDDPLGDLHARNMIDEAQYHAGREFQRHFEAVESGARAIDFTKEAVDGGRLYEGITDARMRSSDMLKIAYEKLGMRGQVYVHEVLVQNLTRKQMAESRGLSGRRWEEYIGTRFRECLDTLAEVYGFAQKR
jgi:hypothetical protein